MDLADKALHIVGGDTVTYGTLEITHRGRTQTLDQWVALEETRIHKMHNRTQLVEQRILEAHEYIDNYSPKLQIIENDAVLHHIDGGTYSETIDGLAGLLLGSAEARHSPQSLKLMKLGIDYLIKSHRKFSRKNGSPYSVHPFMAASIVAAEGTDFSAIIAAMLHDRVEEAVASFTNRRETECRKARKVEIADRASGILYSAGLFFYEQVRRFTFPKLYFDGINSIVDIIDRLSRTEGQTYYEYLEKLFYQKPARRKPMGHGCLIENLDFEMQRAINVFNVLEPSDDTRRLGSGDALVTAYLADIDEYYRNHLGRADNRQSDEEKKRETYRAMIVKLADRLHNTKDMDSAKFSVPKRLYGLGYKNAYFVQHLEEKLSRQKHRRSSDMEMCLDLIMDLRLATLSQLLHDEQSLRRELGDDAAKGMEGLVDAYKRSPDFRQVTPASKGTPLDGMLEEYNSKALGDDSIFHKLDLDLSLQYLHVLAFRSLFENYMAYAAGRVEGEHRFKVSNFDMNLAGSPNSSFATTTLRRSVCR